MDNEKYIGLDVHQATISVAVMDCTGRIIMECIPDESGDDSRVLRRTAG